MSRAMFIPVQARHSSCQSRSQLPEGGTGHISPSNWLHKHTAPVSLLYKMEPLQNLLIHRRRSQSGYFIEAT